MKKSFIYTLFAGVLLFSANLISPTGAKATNTDKRPGAIILGIPPACDCTVPANTFYCVVTSNPILKEIDK